MNERGIYRKLVIGGIVLALVLVTAWASASNMGFKLNYGVVNALNSLLKGSGISFAVEDADSDSTLVINLDLETPRLSPRNSNMGFKLNVTSLPAGPEPGLEVEAPDGTVYWMSWQKNTGGGNSLVLDKN